MITVDKRRTIKELLVHDHEIDLDEMLLDELIDVLQKIKEREGYSEYTRVYIDNDHEYESWYAKIRIKGERQETDEEMRIRLERTTNTATILREKRRQDYLKLKEEFES
jgi:hypothetical protein